DLFGERGNDPRIQLGYGADDTVGNAVEAVTMMTFHDYKSLRLVTSQYHMPRSLVEFRERMPGITIIPHPVFNDSIHPDRWWMDPHTFRLIAGEYSKFLWSTWRSIL
ncbi:MAG: YdcF family protein, partial [Alphaproteobacteria bacterium]|nr:YdcF family protein [Alphaproteobacteria bacterium]